jgi:hypothetical protein
MNVWWLLRCVGGRTRVEGRLARVAQLRAYEVLVLRFLVEASGFTLGREAAND